MSDSYSLILRHKLAKIKQLTGGLWIIIIVLFFDYQRNRFPNGLGMRRKVRECLNRLPLIGRRIPRRPLSSKSSSPKLLAGGSLELISKSV